MQRSEYINAAQRHGFELGDQEPTISATRDRLVLHYASDGRVCLYDNPPDGEARFLTFCRTAKGLQNELARRGIAPMGGSSE